MTAVRFLRTVIVSAEEMTEGIQSFFAASSMC